MPDDPRPVAKAKMPPRLKKTKPVAVATTPITVFGAIPRQIVPIRSASMMLVTAFGEVPLLDVQLFRVPASEEGKPTKSDGGQEEADEPLISMILTLENASFLISDMAGDMQRAISVLAQQCGGDIKPDDQRIKYSAQSLRKAASRLEEAARLLSTDCLSN
jgi:hypothetical protein